MSRKTIPFRTPQKAPGATSPAPEAVASTQGAAADDWVHQSENTAAEQAPQHAPALTITLSTEPNWFDAWKLIFLPYALAWRWSLDAARKAAEGFK